MNEAEILKQADKALEELEEDINTYHALAWTIPFDREAIGKVQGIIDFYELRKSQWMKLLAGADEIRRRTVLELMTCADLEIEGAKSVLYMIQGNEAKAN